MKKFALIIALAAALMATMLTGCLAPTETEDYEKIAEDSASVYTLDVNPGLRIYVSSDETVIAVEATNEDGEAVIAELEVNGEALEDAVETIVDEMFEQGYISDDNNSVLLSIEKNEKEFVEKVNKKINEVFERHGKEACVIEQKLDEIEEEIEKKLEEISEKYDISEGKAHLVEKIREEFPELTEEELAELNVRDLYLILDGASESTKEHFKKHGEILEDLYVGAESAVSAALADLQVEGLLADDVDFLRVHMSREDGKMVYEVEFVYDGNEYEFEIDAESSEILEKEIEEWEALDIDTELRDFYNKHKDFIEGIFEEGKLDIDFIFGERPDGGNNDEDAKPMKTSQLLDLALEYFEIAETELEKTSVKTIKNEDGVVVEISAETEDGTEYKVYIEAFSGLVIKATVNGESLEVNPEGE